jgi:hypothetical protein
MVLLTSSADPSPRRKNGGERNDSVARKRGDAEYQHCAGTGLHNCACQYFARLKRRADENGNAK